jgi:hypothetical protein
MQVSAAGIATFSNTITQDIIATDFRHTDAQTIRINAAAAQVNASGPTFSTSAWVVGTTTAAVVYPITVRTGDVITSWVMFATKTSASGTITATLLEALSTTGATTTIGSAQTNSANAPGNISLTQVGLSHTVTGDTTYYLTITGGGVSGDTFRDLQVNITRP